MWTPLWLSVPGTHHPHRWLCYALGNTQLSMTFIYQCSCVVKTLRSQRSVQTKKSYQKPILKTVRMWTVQFKLWLHCPVHSGHGCNWKKPWGKALHLWATVHSDKSQGKSTDFFLQIYLYMCLGLKGMPSA